MTFKASWMVLPLIAGRVMSQLIPMNIEARQDDTARLVFLDFNQLTSCSSALVRWVYTGPDKPLFLYVSNFNVPQTASTTSEPPATFTNIFPNRPPVNNDKVEDIFRPIAISISPENKQYNWTSIDVPAGFYVLQAEIDSSPPYSTISSPFLVQEASDTSCLSVNPSSSSSSPSSSSSATSSSTSPATSTSPPSSSDVLLPSVTPVGASGSGSTNKGAIAGGVIAGVAVLIVALALYLIFIYRPRRSRSRVRNPTSPYPQSPSKAGFGFGKSDGGRWGGLSSVDSHMAMNDTAYTNQKIGRNDGHAVGGANAPQTYLAGKRSNGSVSQQYTASPVSPSDEKFIESDEPGVAALAYRKGSIRSQRRPSATLEPPAQSRRPSTESTASNAMSPFATPPSSSPIGLARAPSTGSTIESPHTAAAGQSSRKTPRKPVPAYIPDPSLEVEPVSTSPVSPYVDSSGSPFDTPAVPLPSGGGGHYITRAERESLKLASPGGKKSKRSQSKGRNKDSPNGSSEDMAHNLVHKNSFGPGGIEGKPLHYLIPDMPARQQ